MKIFTALVLSFILLLVCPFSVQASCHPPVLKTEGYTEEAVRYEVHGTFYVQLTSDSIFVTRQVTYDGFVIPSSQVFWREKINDITYSGNLQLKKQNFNPKTQKTTATYEGTLTSE